MSQAVRDDLEALIHRFRITEPKPFRLADHDPASTDGIKNKAAAKAQLAAGIELLTDLQSRLAAAQTSGVLVALQAMDTAGKDGVIRHVMSGLNPQGVRVTPFKAPSTRELAHHFLWRTTLALPQRGEIGIFNRSHYEEVLVVRVHPEFLERQQLPATATTAGLWKRRFREINDWERTLVDNGFPVVKIFLYLSKREQRKRLLARIDEPAKNWKFSHLDVQERSHWEAYQRAYEEMIRHTSTPAAPWYVVPADQKWFSRLVVASALAATLLDIDPQFPTVSDEQRVELAEARTVLAADTGE
ncbi:MAG: polyphosphate kinase 2 family protein [Acidimicrobiia bacterium]|nr:polyphosphate kinase 2 family protein [Acidimicrobiia bacterium]